MYSNFRNDTQLTHKGGFKSNFELEVVPPYFSTSENPSQI